jgi:cellobiose phosphorylase
MVGNGNRAFDYYTRINPSARENIGELHRCEPYVFAQMVAGKDAPTYGEAKNSWLTGAAAWTYFTVTQWIFGIRTEYDGLRVDPVIPARWKGFTVTRRFRGNTYVIEVKNPQGKQRGVKKLLVNGREIAGDILPVRSPHSKPIRVEAVLEG